MRHLFLIAVLTATFSGCGLDNITWIQEQGIQVTELSVPAAEFDAQYGKGKLAVVDYDNFFITYRGWMIDDLCVRDAEHGKLRNKLEGYDYNKYAFPCRRLVFGEWEEYGRVR